MTMTIHDPLAQVNTRATPQSEPIDGTVPNSAGGHAYQLDDWGRLRRFLILGTVGGTYYINERDLTKDNVAVVKRLILKDGPRVVREIVEVSEEGRAPKQNPTIFTLALCAGSKDLVTKQAALAALPRVCRIGTHLFMFIRYVEQFRGWGPMLQRAVAEWYLKPRPRIAGVDEIEEDSEAPPAEGDALELRHANWLAYQIAKYQRREGWSHKDLIALCRRDVRWRGLHGREPLDYVLRAAMGELDLASQAAIDDVERIPATILQWKAAQAVDKPALTAQLVKESEGRLSWEMLRSDHLGDAQVWRELMKTMPIGALVRNLARLTANGAVKPMSADVTFVTTRLTDEERVRGSRLHPMQVLLAAKQYELGHGDKGKLKWIPIPQILDALDITFQLAFKNVEPTNKRTLLALDVSGSMTHAIAGTTLSAREGAAAMALITARTEPNVHTIAFSDGAQRLYRSWGYGNAQVQVGLNPDAYYFVHRGHRHSVADTNVTAVMPFPIGQRTTLNQLVRQMQKNDLFGGTDCALPMIYAVAQNLEVDTFVIYTDSETWAGDIHPSQALVKYREHSGINAKLVVVGMTATEFTIADPTDPGMFDVVGFDSAAPAVIADFSAGRV
jgi:60 kDa SS-A/Ro ribonucleoprotein